MRFTSIFEPDSFHSEQKRVWSKDFVFAVYSTGFVLHEGALASHGAG